MWDKLRFIKFKYVLLFYFLTILVISLLLPFPNTIEDQFEVNSDDPVDISVNYVIYGMKASIELSSTTSENEVHLRVIVSGGSTARYIHTTFNSSFIDEFDIKHAGRLIVTMYTLNGSVDVNAYIKIQGYSLDKIIPAGIGLFIIILFILLEKFKSKTIPQIQYSIVQASPNKNRRNAFLGTMKDEFNSYNKLILVFAIFMMIFDHYPEPIGIYGRADRWGSYTEEDVVVWQLSAIFLSLIFLFSAFATSTLLITKIIDDDTAKTSHLKSYPISKYWFYTARIITLSLTIFIIPLFNFFIMIFLSYYNKNDFDRLNVNIIGNTILICLIVTISWVALYMAISSLSTHKVFKIGIGFFPYLIYDHGILFPPFIPFFGFYEKIVGVIRHNEQTQSLLFFQALINCLFAVLLGIIIMNDKVITISQNILNQITRLFKK
jgi:hypothetical protein